MVCDRETGRLPAKRLGQAVIGVNREGKLLMLEAGRVRGRPGGLAELVRVTGGDTAMMRAAAVLAWGRRARS